MEFALSFSEVTGMYRNLNMLLPVVNALTGLTTWCLTDNPGFSTLAGGQSTETTEVTRPCCLLDVRPVDDGEAGWLWRRCVRLFCNHESAIRQGVGVGWGVWGGGGGKGLWPLRNILQGILDIVMCVCECVCGLVCVCVVYVSCGCVCVCMYVVWSVCVWFGLCVHVCMHACVRVWMCVCVDSTALDMN